MHSCTPAFTCTQRTPQVKSDPVLDEYWDADDMMQLFGRYTTIDAELCTLISRTKVSHSPDLSAPSPYQSPHASGPATGHREPVAKGVLCIESTPQRVLELGLQRESGLVGDEPEDSDVLEWPYTVGGGVPPPPGPPPQTPSPPPSSPSNV